MKKLFLLAALLFPLAVAAQIPIDHDWARFSRYESENAQVKKQPVAVLFGDSITNNWAKEDNAWLQEHHFLGRGIGGQTTLQMLARFRTDVIELHPQYVAILAGINDIARNTGYIDVKNTFGNIVSMVELAQVNGIRPVLCTVLPAGEIGWRKEVGDPRPLIDSLNALIRQYAQEHQLPLVDYHAAMKDAENALDAAYVTDAVHPNLAGYKVMEKLLLEVLEKDCRLYEKK